MSRAVVISDVHIGDGTPTVWYQKSVHEPYLATILDYVIDMGTKEEESIRELVLLGDIVDLWTYPPDVTPPTVSAIIAANPNILGPTGKLAAAVKAVQARGGAVTFVRGNHDASLTHDDINALAGGEITLGDHVLTLTDSAGKRKTTLSHGHLWTMFNAPDLTSTKAKEWNNLPLGHFVTRTFAYQMAHSLKQGQTVADLPNQGAPNGFNLLSFLESIITHPDPDMNIASLLLNYCATIAKLNENERITLADGSHTSLKEAKSVYSTLFSRWVHSEGGILPALRAAMADQDSQYLAWYAQRLALQTGSDLVVLGHTHTEVSGLTPSPVNYINSGFECPSTPDMPAKEPTFAVIDLETATPELYQVRKSEDGYLIDHAKELTQSPIPKPGRDYSCYISIENRTSTALTLQNHTTLEGTWVVPPPPTIPANETATCWLQDHVGQSGSAGKLTYGTPGGNTTFTAQCAYLLLPNRVSSSPPVEFTTKVGHGDWQPPGVVPPLGYPLQAHFVVPKHNAAP